MTKSFLYSIVVLASLLSVTVSSGNTDDITNLNPKEGRNLLFNFGTRRMRQCLTRELMELNHQFDAREYKRMIFAEGGITQEEQLREAYINNQLEEHTTTPWSQTLIHQNLMQAIQRRSSELNQVTEIIKACRQEADGGTSAVGKGKEVGTFLKEASQKPLDNNSTRGNLRRQLSWTDHLFPKPLQEPLQDLYHPAGYHMEGGLGLDMSFSAFFSHSRICGGVEFGLGVEAGIIIAHVENVKPPLVDDPAIFYDMDIASGAAVGMAIGAYQNAGALIFEVTIGAGLGFGAGFTYCLDSAYEEAPVDPNNNSTQVDEADEAG